jgi:CubicO group peptidase (beta-lactamase class C family)
MGEVALPYLSNGKPLANGPRIHPELAAAGLWTTPSDLARYALGVTAALAGESSVISAATAREMLTRVTGDFGLGPFLSGNTSRKLFAHSGGNFGYRCFLVAYEDGEGAVVMTNGDRGDELTEQVIRAVARVYGWPDYAGH